MAAEPDSAETRIGPLRVCADEERVIRYRREIGFPDTPEKIVPVAFPAVWLTTDEIASAIRDFLAGEDLVPVQELQSFHYFAPLRVGESYDLTVSVRREAEPPRLSVNASLATLAGETRLHAETLLRIFPRPTGVAGAP